MRKIQELFSLYGESHQNHTNKLIHWICVPSIFFSIVGMVYSIPVIGEYEKSVLINWATLGLFMVLIYYLRLSRPMFLAFIVWGGLCLIGSTELYRFLGADNSKLALVNLGIFALAWVGQFIGHGIEGKRPSFLQDLQFLLIGPAWLMHFLFKKVGLKY